MKDMQDEEAVPHSPAAEKQVLGALLNRNDLLEAMPPDLPSIFYDPVHADIAREIARRIALGEKVTVVTLSPWADGHQGVQALGGARYLPQLTAQGYADIAKDQARFLADLRDRRAVLAAAQRAAELAQDHTESVLAAPMAFAEMVRDAKIGGPLALETIPAASLAGAPVPPREWLVEDLIPHATVTMLGGDGGTGKSLIALQLAAACAAGTDWIGRAITRPGPALLVSAEDSAEELHRRLAAVAEAEGQDLAALGDLHLSSLAGEDAILARTTAPRAPCAPPTATAKCSRR